MINGTPSILQGMRVLMVEDRIENRRLLNAILRLEGASVLEAWDGQQGVDLAQKELPDLILMDLQMPVLDGLEATKILREAPATRPIPIIFITASASDEARADAFKAGGDGFLTKPIDPLLLSSQIETILSQRNS